MRKKSVIGIIWSFIEVLTRHSFSLIVQIILARILMPEHFGLIGMITIFMAIATALVTSGLDQALIREEKIENESLSTVFFFNLFFSLSIYLISFFIAPIIATFYNEPALVNILRVMMLIVIINSLSITQRVILVRELNFKRETKITLLSSIISGVFAILLALMNFGVWALVFQQIILRTCMLIFLYRSHNWKPTLVFNISLFKYYFKFGYKLMISGLVNAVNQNIFQVIIGRLFSLNDVGYFTNSKKLADVPSHAFTHSIERATYPILSDIKDNPQKLRKSYEVLIKGTAFIYFPVTMYLIYLAPYIIPTLLGEQWLPSVPFFQLLALASMIHPINILNLNIFKVVGRTDMYLKVTIIRTVFLLLMLIFGIAFKISIEGFIIISIFEGVFAWFINSIVVSQFINYKMFIQLGQLLKIGVPSSIAFLTMKYVEVELSSGIFSQITMGSIILIILSILLNYKDLIELFNIIKNAKKFNNIRKESV